jgi:8-oxo-dGTP diphosphatase
VREILEETGLQIKGDNVRFLTATNDVMASEHKHYVTIFVGCRPESGGLEPRVRTNSSAKADEECNVQRATADHQ